MNFPHILSTICDTHFPILLSAVGIDLTLPIPWPYTSLGTLYLLLEPRLQPTVRDKANAPLRPIVSCVNTFAYDLSAHLANILSPLTGKSEYTVTNSAHFVST